MDLPLTKKFGTQRETRQGLHKASGEVLALADSDIVMDPDWLGCAVPQLLAQSGCVAVGGMKRTCRWLWTTASPLTFIVAGIGLRFWQLGSSAWQHDKIIYTDVASSVSRHGLVESTR